MTCAVLGVAVCMCLALCPLNLFTMAPALRLLLRLVRREWGTRYIHIYIGCPNSLLSLLTNSKSKVLPGSVDEVVKVLLVLVFVAVPGHGSLWLSWGLGFRV